MPETQTQPTTYQGPDGKYYKFPSGTTQDKANDFFKKSPRFAAKATPTGSGEVADPSAMRSSMLKPFTAGASGAANYAVDQLPNAGGFVGDLIGGKSNVVGIGASFAGGAGGEFLRQFIQLTTSNPNAPKGMMDENMRALKAGATQAGLAGVGRGIGELLAKAAYIPAKYRLQIKNGIPRFPWEVTPSKTYQYLGSLLENLFPSAGNIAKVREVQTPAVLQAGEKVANAMSKFRGTSEELGQLFQHSLEQSRQAAFSKLGRPPSQAELQTFNETFFNGIIQKITGAPEVKETVTLTGKAAKQPLKKKFAQKIVDPSEVLGMIRGSSIEDVRKLRTVLGKPEYGSTLNAAKTQLLKEGLTESLKNGKFQGEAFSQYLDKIGENKLQELYGDKAYKALKEFADFTKNINGGMNGGIGRWLNYGLGAGIFYKPSKAAATVLGINTLARMMSTEEGTQFLKNYEIALAKHAPQAIHAAADAMKTSMRNATFEQQTFEMHLKQIEEQSKQQYLKENNVK